MCALYNQFMYLVRVFFRQKITNIIIVVLISCRESLSMQRPPQYQNQNQVPPQDMNIKRWNSPTIITSTRRGQAVRTAPLLEMGIISITEGVRSPGPCQRAQMMMKVIMNTYKHTPHLEWNLPSRMMICESSFAFILVALVHLMNIHFRSSSLELILFVFLIFIVCLHLPYLSY